LGGEAPGGVKGKGEAGAKPTARDACLDAVSFNFLAYFLRDFAFRDISTFETLVGDSAK